MDVRVARTVPEQCKYCQRNEDEKGDTRSHVARKRLPGQRGTAANTDSYVSRNVQITLRFARIGALRVQNAFVFVFSEGLVMHKKYSDGVRQINVQRRPCNARILFAV